MNEYPLQFYSQIFLNTISIISFLIGYRNRKKYSILRNLYLYPLFSLLQSLVFYLTLYVNPSVRLEEIIIRTSIYIFLFLEFILIYQFFSRTFKLVNLPKTFFALKIIFITLFVFYLYYNNNSTFFLNEFYILQSVYILIPSFLYLVHFFKKPITATLIDEPSFWITIGLVFYFSCTFPIFLLKDFFFAENGYIYEAELFSINYICYGILFLLIAKAYLCKKLDPR